ncbi:MAG: hypothetical protein L6Q49_20920 [Anaerolineales bacterium]|nr:hypothetical protein [Anaerolineales bacterium]
MKTSLIMLGIVVLLLAGCGDTSDVAQPTAAVMSEAELKALARARTIDLFSEIEQGISKWRNGEGKPGTAYPKSGVNSLERRFNGNMLLFRALVSDPVKKGKKPYVEVIDDMICYLDKDGETVRESGDESRRIFVDGFGTPIIYWEWASKTQNIGGDPTEGFAPPVSAKELGLARNKKGYDLYSAGEDKAWGTADDMNAQGEIVNDGPFK